MQRAITNYLNKAELEEYERLLVSHMEKMPNLIALQVKKYYGFLEQHFGFQSNYSKVMLPLREFSKFNQNLQLDIFFKIIYAKWILKLFPN